ncbi:helix-turn-helix transcriptional regulator [Georgenia sp. MJ173]|uniref:helix-turn-helix transcriptional regulator n=1 Tax=Georgenia sunbinii TaxID=3117728 RepID=UPI002F262FB9
MTANDEQTTSPPEEHFARALRDALEEHDMSQQALADAMSSRGHRFHQATVYKILRGTRKVTLGEALDIATILGEDLQTMTVPQHESAIRKLMSTSHAALTAIGEQTGRFLTAQRNVIQLLDARDDWDPATREAAETWRSTGGPEEAVKRGRDQWQRGLEQRWTARLTAEEINAEIEEARMRRRGEYPEAP